MKTSTWSQFLKDVLICALGAYGGPEAHFGVLTDQLVIKKKYLTEEELIELIALSGLLPGPSSTQTIVAIGYKIGGPVLGFLTMLVWAILPLIIMTALSFLYGFLAVNELSTEGLRFIGPMAVGFILVAAYRIGKKVLTDPLTIGIFSVSVALTYFIRSSLVFPAVLILGGFAAILASGERDLWNQEPLTPRWIWMGLFLFFAIAAPLLARATGSILAILFEKFYRYGYLVFGGGQVVVPMMHGELVDLSGYMTSQEFLTGYGLVQGVPGPMFSFSAYAGGMAARGFGPAVQIIGAVISDIGIFLPGILLIYFVYPLWEDLKKIRGIKLSLRGINAAAGGMISAAAIRLFLQSGITAENLLVIALTTLLLFTKKVPAPLIVLAVVILGFLVL